MSRVRTTLAVSLAGLAGVLYAAMWMGHTRWGWLHDLDWSLLTPAHDIGIKSPAWVRFWDGVSFALGPVPLRLLGTLAALVSLLQRNVRLALLLFCCAPLSGLLTVAAKDLDGRPRPATALVAVAQTSFPSGHALEATAGVLALLTFLLPMIKARWIRVAVVAVSALSVLTVGVARVALNVHHPSDVIAGWSLGYLYFVACWLLFRPQIPCSALFFGWSQRSDATGSKPLLDPGSAPP
jgi:membrane-associated phospholipid phosphatase